MLIVTIKKDQLDARKSRDALRATLLTTLLGDIIRVGKDKGNRDTTDEEAVTVIKKHLKAIEENLALDLPESKIFQFSQEKEILAAYLPKQASEEELVKVVTSNRGMSKGELFQTLKQLFGGNFDAKLVNKLLK